MNIKRSSDKFKSHMVSITDAERFGTTFYKATLQDVIDALVDDNANVWLITALVEDGFYALDLDSAGLSGSAVINNEIYICVSDGYAINLDGHEIEPEEALTSYSLEELEPFIQEATPDVITRYITTYELKMRDVESLAIAAMDEGYSFNQLYEDYKDFVTD